MANENGNKDKSLSSLRGLQGRMQDVYFEILPAKPQRDTSKEEESGRDNEGQREQADRQLG